MSTTNTQPGPDEPDPAEPNPVQPETPQEFPFPEPKYFPIHPAIPTQPIHEPTPERPIA